MVRKTVYCSRIIAAGFSVAMFATMLPPCAVAQETIVGAGGVNAFSGRRAFLHLEAICDIGPRPTGSAGMLRQKKMLIEYFRGQGAQVEEQPFQIRDRRSGKSLQAANVIIQWHPDRLQRVLLGAHFDTRPFPDRDPVDPKGVFVGANDGGSGVALLMELGKGVQLLPGPLGVDFILFDAEEYVFTTRDPYCLGSRWFARQYVDRPPAYQYRMGVVVDMVADKNLELWQEQNGLSWPDTRPIVDSIWKTASQMNVREFIPRPKWTIEDDHLPLRNVAKIPTCDIIDFDYPHWHTTQDIPENCSGESLEIVGKVLLKWLQSIE